MFQPDATREFVQVHPDSISLLYQSVTNTSVVLPGRGAATASAVVVGYRVAPKVYGVLIALHLIEARRHLVYAYDDPQLAPEFAPQAAEEAIAYVESMGFFMENVGWKTLDPVARRERLAALKVFMPPEGSAEPAKIVDPRTKLARLLVQF